MFYHTAADKKEALVEEDGQAPDDDPLGDGGYEKPPKEVPPPEIATRDLPGIESDEAYSEVPLDDSLTSCAVRWCSREATRTCLNCSERFHATC